jgi:hypothetical protein
MNTKTPLVTCAELPNNTWLITQPRYAGFTPCAFYKDEDGRVTRLWDAVYYDLNHCDTPVKVVTREEAIAHAQNMWK